jgi:BirA family biotin operon repressor/biotin-[acetyl-CoA-carboxylase] ligase
MTRWTLAASLAACEACRLLAGGAVQIKWPNDLLYLGRKLGGILAEARSAGGASQELVIGLGLNVHHGEDQFPPELRAEATSLRMAGAPGVLDREALAADYLSRLGDLSGGLARGEWSEIAERWESLAPGSRGLRVRVVADGFEGLTCGIDGDGALQVRDGKGITTVVRMAEAVEPVER